MGFRRKGSFLPEISNALATLRPRKVWNFLLLYFSYHFSRLTGRSFHAGMPFSIAVEPTTSCNLRCPECPSGLRSFSRPTGMMEPSSFSALLLQLRPWLGNMTFYFQGEPFLNPSFLDMVALAVKNGVYTSSSTNAHYLRYDMALRTVQSGLHKLLISIDGASQESYEQYRIGGSLEKVLEGTRNLVRAKKELGSSTPHLVFQFLVVRPNEHDIPAIEQLARNLGVDEVKIKTAQIYDFENGSDLIPSQEKYARYKQGADGKFKLKNQLLNQCWKMWHSAVVTWDGSVLPCCFDKDGHYRLGTLGKETFREIWKGRDYHNFRQAILKSRQETDICRNCTEGTRVWADD